jgi:hypothetical protein
LPASCSLGRRITEVDESTDLRRKRKGTAVWNSAAASPETRLLSSVDQPVMPYGDLAYGETDRTPMNERITWQPWQPGSQNPEISRLPRPKGTTRTADGRERAPTGAPNRRQQVRFPWCSRSTCAMIGRSSRAPRKFSHLPPTLSLHGGAWSRTPA